ncbi:MAG: C40 family peptidase [Acidimicrobiales bacterium]
MRTPTVWGHVQRPPAGIELPRTTAGQIAVGVEVEPAGGLVIGDLLFFRGGRPTHDLGHVAIYAGDGLMVIAPRTGDVVSLRPVPEGKVQAARRVAAGPDRRPGS